MFRVWRRWLVCPQGAAESWEGSSRFDGSLKPARKPPFIQHLFSPDGRKLKERKAKWSWTQPFDFLRVKRANASCFHNQLGWGNTWFHRSRRRTAHFISSWATERKKKDVRLWRLFQFPQRPRSSSTEQPWWSWSWWSWWCLEPAVKERRQLLELPAASTADLESADVWRTLPPLPQETQAAPFSPSLSFFSREDSKSSSSTADMSFSPPLFFPSFPQMFFHRHFMHKQVESSAEDFNLKDKHLSVIMGAWEKLHRKKYVRAISYAVKKGSIAERKGFALEKREEVMSVCMDLASVGPVVITC